MILILW